MNKQPIKIIDFHTHTFPEAIAPHAIARLSAASHTKAFTDGTEAGLCISMRSAGIQRSVVLPVATSPAQVIKINDASLRINEHTAETGILSFGCMHPDFADWYAELGRIHEAGIRGIKLHPVYQGVDFDHPRYLRILERASELGMVVLIHAGLDVGFPGVVHASPRMVVNALNAVGKMSLVLAHMGGWRCWDEVKDLLPPTGVYIDTSFSLGRMTPGGDGYYTSEDQLRLLDNRHFMTLVRAFGPERVLFGTDSPWADQSDALRQILDLPLTEAELESILYKNAETLIG